jgi:uncharacterized protein
MNPRGPETFCSRDLGGNNPFGITRSAAGNARVVLRRNYERWNGIHVSGKNDRRALMSGESGEDVVPSAFYRHPDRLISKPRKLGMQKIAHSPLVAADRFDVDELPGKLDDVHGKENTAPVRFAGKPPHKQSRAEFVSVSGVSQNSTIRSFFIDGPAGRLEALVNAGAATATHAALVCHPHPLYGGTLHNKVVFHTMKALNSFGFPVLRFNFRGTGLSQGEHADGVGEGDDVRAALDWLDREFHLPMIFAGFSFGAAVGLQAACPDPRVRAVIGLGIPVVPADDRTYDFGFLENCAKPKLFVSGDRDQFGPSAKLRQLVDSLPEPKKLVIIDGGDHFFEGRLRELRETIESWVRTL